MRTRYSIAALLVLFGAACGSDGKKDQKPSGGSDAGGLDSGGGGGDGDGDQCNPEGATMSTDSAVWTIAEWDACIATDVCGGDTIKTQEDFDACVDQKCAPNGNKFFACLDDNLYACETGEVGPGDQPGPCRTQYVSLACCDDAAGCAANATSQDDYLACLNKSCQAELTAFQGCQDEVSYSLRCKADPKTGLDPETGMPCPFVSRCANWMAICLAPQADAGTPEPTDGGVTDGGTPAADGGTDGGTDSGADNDAAVPPPPPPHAVRRANLLKQLSIRAHSAARSRVSF
jgi:hypothetical protein